MTAALAQDFGTLRSLTHRASWGAWKTLCGMLDRHEQSWDEPMMQQQVLPYLRAQLDRWPAEVVRFAQHHWIERALCGQDVPQLALANAVQFVSQDLSGRRLGRLLDSPDICGLEVIDTRAMVTRRDATFLLDLLSAPHLSKLRGLNLSGSRVGVEGLEMLAEAQASRELEWLDISACQLSSLGPLPRAQHLVDLRASSNRLRGRALSGILEGSGLPALERLDLRRNPIQEEVTRRLRQMAQERALEELLL